MTRKNSIDEFTTARDWKHDSVVRWPADLPRTCPCHGERLNYFSGEMMACNTLSCSPQMPHCGTGFGSDDYRFECEETGRKLGYVQLAVARRDEHRFVHEKDNAVLTQLDNAARRIWARWAPCHKWNQNRELRIGAALWWPRNPIVDWFDPDFSDIGALAARVRRTWAERMIAEWKAASHADATVEGGLR